MVKWRLNIKAQLLLLLGITAVGMISVAAVSFFESRQGLQRIEKEKLQRISLAAEGIIKSYYKQSETGALPEFTAQAKAVDTIKSIHYKGNLHYWVYSSDGYVVLDSLYPGHEGKKLNELRFAENLQKILGSSKDRNKNQGKFLQYDFKEQGKTIEYQAYSRTFEPWGWVLVTANNREVINNILTERLQSVFVVILILLSIVLIFSVLLIRNIVSPLERIKNSIVELAKGNFDVKITDLEVHDEIGDIARTLEEFRKTSNYVVSLQQSKEESEFQLRSDALTGLANRVAIEEVAEKLGPRRRAKDLKTSFALIDLNKFKPINDTFGHKAGDETLVAVANWLREAANPGDIVARLGGDEFGIVISNIESYDALKQYGEKLASLFGNSIVYEDNDIVIEASIGLAYGPDVEGTFENLVSAADKAMYSIKDNRKHIYAIYDHKIHAEKLDLKARDTFLEALANEEVVPYYQPKIDLNTHEIIGFEALARWEHPIDGVLAPGAFFNLIEEYNLHQVFNNLIIKKVLEQISFWNQQGYKALPISINVDEQTLATASGLANMEALFDMHSDILHLISIEITEDVFVARAADAIRNSIETLNDRGIRISMDDFGTGYGSFKHLQEFPFDELKIDMEFTRGIGKDRSSEVIIDGFLSIAEGLGAIVVAEGVETPEQAEYLRLRGCHYGQGYLYGKAMHADKAIELINEQDDKKVVNI